MSDKRIFTVTDGMGRMSSDEMNDGYAVANRLSKCMHNAKAYSLKKICEVNYTCKFGRAPSAVTEGMKTYTRFTLKNPERVYIICPEVTGTIQSKIDMWCNDPERKFKITTIETAGVEPRVATYTPPEKVFAPTFTQVTDFKHETWLNKAEDKADVKPVKYFVKIKTADGRTSKRLRKSITYDAHYDEDISDARQCSITWGQAFGWTFSAPLTRGVQYIDADYHTYRNRLSVFGAGKRVQDKIDKPDIKISTKASLYKDWWYSKLAHADNSDAIWDAVQYSRRTLCDVEHDSDYVILSKGALYKAWWYSKLSGFGDPDSIWNAIQCYDRTPEKEPEHDTYYIARDELEANHAKLSPTRHTVGAFQTEFVKRAPESECEEFFKHYKKIRANAGRHHMWVMGQKDPIFYETEARDENGHLTFYTTEGYRFDSYLEPDWATCPKCGKPYKTIDAGESGGICGHCKAELDITAISRLEQYAVNNALYGDSSSDEN